jgi:hypothetical protein
LRAGRRLGSDLASPQIDADAGFAGVGRFGFEQ